MMLRHTTHMMPTSIQCHTVAKIGSISYLGSNVQ